mmetsp:Transcript_47823/g.51691  ORF Transcript_47823/g.51691 Transcript_47823/m.51691 type:complete len:139 (-) Transcript_47823:645-1061(-)
MRVAILIARREVVSNSTPTTTLTNMITSLNTSPTYTSENHHHQFPMNNNHDVGDLLKETINDISTAATSTINTLRSLASPGGGLAATGTATSPRSSNNRRNTTASVSSSSARGGGGGAPVGCVAINTNTDGFWRKRKQ